MADEDPAVRDWRDGMKRRPTPEVADEEPKPDGWGGWEDSDE